MTVFLTSDHHFDHPNILDFQPRIFENMDAHNDHLVNCWNSVIGNNDVVYYLGDFTMRANAKSALEFLIRLNGVQINFILGNHDYWARHFEFGGRYNLLEKIHTLRHNGKRIVLCHYAMKSWERRDKGYLHCFGHSHGNLIDPEVGSMDIGVDTNAYYPYQVDDIIERLVVN